MSAGFLGVVGFAFVGEGVGAGGAAVADFDDVVELAARGGNVAAGGAADPVAVADGAGHAWWWLVGGADVGHGVAGEGFGYEPARSRRG